MESRRQVERIVIDLEKFTITITFRNNYNELELFFDTPGRRFYFSLIALVVKEMKEKKGVCYVPIMGSVVELKFLDQNLSGEEASKDDPLMFDKVRKAWRNRLPDLRKAPLFKVVNRNSIKDFEGYEYDCSDDECDIWASLFGYNEAKKWCYKLAVDNNLIAIDLKDVELLFKEEKGLKAWKSFYDHLEAVKQQEIQEESLIPQAMPMKEAMIQFLADIESRFEHIMLLHPNERLTLKSQYVPIHVTTEKKSRHQVESSRGCYDSEEEVRILYGFKGFDEESEPYQNPWGEVKRNYNRIVVLADPGMGKSTLLKHEAWETASQEKEALSQNRKEVKEVSVPILLRLYDINKSDKAISETILELVKKEYPQSSTAILKVLKDKIEGGKCPILLDAIDEVPVEQRNELSIRLNDFGRTYQGKIICTSRIVGYSGWFLDRAKEVEIVPFSLGQISEYVGIWFRHFCPSDKEDLRMAEGLLLELRNKPQLKGLSQNPLLLSLLCRLYLQNKLMLPVRRVDIYREVLKYLLSEWKKLKKRESEFMIIPKMTLLEALAYDLNCQGKDIFSAEYLYTWIERYLHKDEVPSDFKRYTATELISELSEQDGIIVKLDSGGEKHIFLHRTFQEFLAASYINKQMKKDLARGLEMAQSHFWNYEWHETVTLLAGLMEDPAPLIETIFAKKDDIFSTLLLLAGSCLTETTPLPHNFDKKVIDSIFDLWRKYPYINQIAATVAALSQSRIYMLEKVLHFADTKSHDSSQISSIIFTLRRINTPRTISKMIELYEDDTVELKHLIAMFLGEMGTSDAADALIKNLRNDHPSVRNYAVQALSNIRTERVIESLIDTLNGKPKKVLDLDPMGENWFADAMCALAIAQALLNYGTSESIEVVIRAINHQHFPMTNAACTALATLGEKAPPQVIRALLKALEGNDKWVKRYACKALGDIRTRDAIEPLSRILRNHKMPSELRECAAKALGEIGDPGSDDGLIAALKDPDDEVKRNACESLSKIGTGKAIEALINASNNKDPKMRSYAIRALKNIAPSQAIPVLRSAIEDVSQEVRESAAISLGEIGTDEAIDLLMKATNDPDLEVRWSAVNALGETGNHRALEILYRTLSDGNDKIKRCGINALGKIGASKITEELVSALNDDDLMLRSYAAQALSKCDTVKSANLLVEALKDGKIEFDTVIENMDSGLGLKVLGKIIELPEVDIFADGFFSMTRSLAIRYRNHGAWFIPVYHEVIQKARKEGC